MKEINIRNSEMKKAVQIIFSKSSSNKPTSKEKQAFLLFFPIVLIGLLSKSLDNLMDCSKFQKAKNYFKFLYGLRLCIFIFVIVTFRIAKKFLSSKYVMYVLYAYNLLFLAIDICIITQFTEDYQEFSSYSFYKTLYLKMMVNYIFGSCWIVMLFLNLIRQ